MKGVVQALPTEISETKERI